MARILLVDDEPDLLHTLADILKGEGHVVEVAKHGADALRSLSRLPLPDLVLLDLLMPVMDGWTFLTRVRERPELANLDIVVVSASYRAADEAAERGVRFLPKPISIASLLEHVARVEPSARRPSYPSSLEVAVAGRTAA